MVLSLHWDQILASPAIPTLAFSCTQPLPWHTSQYIGCCSIAVDSVNEAPAFAAIPSLFHYSHPTLSRPTVPNVHLSTSDNIQRLPSPASIFQLSCHICQQSTSILVATQVDYLILVLV